VASTIGAFPRLAYEDRQAFSRLTGNTISVEARRDLICEGDKPRLLHLVIEGWAAAYKSLPDGRRQIVNLFVPGDFCDLNAYVFKTMDHSIGAITRLKVAGIKPEDMIALTAERPRIAQALWWQELVTSAIQREWALNLGQRNAYQRLGHLLLELYLRLKAVGRARDGRCDFPLTQTDLAETTGLTAVHVNRTLQELRGDGLIELERRQLHIVDEKGLMEASLFNPNYLHLDVGSSGHSGATIGGLSTMQGSQLGAS
jgi:CRP-like cAMP-binding protein